MMTKCLFWGEIQLYILFFFIARLSDAVTFHFHWGKVNNTMSTLLVNLFTHLLLCIVCASTLFCQLFIHSSFFLYERWEQFEDEPRGSHSSDAGQPQCRPGRVSQPQPTRRRYAATRPPRHVLQQWATVHSQSLSTLFIEVHLFLCFSYLYFLRNCIICFL